MALKYQIQHCTKEGTTTVVAIKEFEVDDFIGLEQWTRNVFDNNRPVHGVRTDIVKEGDERFKP